MEDILATVSEEDLRVPDPPPLTIADSQADLWWEKFQYDQYDWNDPSFVGQNQGERAYRPILLTKGYFMMVSPDQYTLMTEFPDGSKKNWQADVRKDKETGEIVAVYAKRYARMKERAANFSWHVYAHRELLGLTGKTTRGDHISGLKLDNRDCNLDNVTASVNNRNYCVSRRNIHEGHAQGIEERGKGYWGGKIFFTDPKTGKRSCKRSEIRWQDPKMAKRWYDNERGKLNARNAWADKPRTLDYPTFPPQMDSEPETITTAAQPPKQENQVPF